jgi:hypothetical protein
VPSQSAQLFGLFVLALPVAAVAWTVTHEEIFREIREGCVTRSKTCARLYQRKFFYLLTCEYCFSHYVTAFFLLVTRFKLMFPDWRGYLVALFAIVWVANIYMSCFGRLRLDIKHERVEIAATEIDVKKKESKSKPDGLPQQAERPQSVSR